MLMVASIAVAAFNSQVLVDHLQARPWGPGVGERAGPFTRVADDCCRLAPLQGGVKVGASKFYGRDNETS